MKDKFDRRVVNARRLLDLAGNGKDFAAKVGIKPAQVSQLMGANPSSNIGQAIAQRIERAHDKPKGWLDADHDKINAHIDGKLDVDGFIDAAMALNDVLTEQGIDSFNIDKDKYRQLLSNIIINAASSGGITVTQIESSLELSGLGD